MVLGRYSILQLCKGSEVVILEQAASFWISSTQGPKRYKSVQGVRKSKGASAVICFEHRKNV